MEDEFAARRPSRARWTRLRAGHLQPIAIALVFVTTCAGAATGAALYTGKDVKDNSIRGADVRSGSLTGAQVRDGSLTSGDVDLTDVTRPQGPVGPRGRDGAKGATGEVGATGDPGRSGSATIQIGLGFGTVPGGRSGVFEAQCPAGFKPIGGGVEVSDEVNGVITGSSPNQTGTGWRVEAHNKSSSSIWLYTRVICTT